MYLCNTCVVLALVVLSCCHADPEAPELRDEKHANRAIHVCGLAMIQNCTKQMWSSILENEVTDVHEVLELNCVIWQDYASCLSKPIACDVEESIQQIFGNETTVDVHGVKVEINNVQRSLVVHVDEKSLDDQQTGSSKVDDSPEAPEETESSSKPQQTTNSPPETQQETDSSAEATQTTASPPETQQEVESPPTEQTSIETSSEPSQQTTETSTDTSPTTESPPNEDEANVRQAREVEKREVAEVEETSKQENKTAMELSMLDGWRYFVLDTTFFLKRIQLCTEMNYTALLTLTRDITDYFQLDDVFKRGLSKCFATYPCFVTFIEDVRKARYPCDALGDIMTCVKRSADTCKTHEAVDDYVTILETIWNPVLVEIRQIPDFCESWDPRYQDKAADEKEEEQDPELVDTDKTDT